MKAGVIADIPNYVNINVFLALFNVLINSINSSAFIQQLIQQLVTPTR